MEIMQNSGRQRKPADNTLQLTDILYLCMAKWKWFALSLAVCVGLSVLYILRTPPTYTRTASLLIKEDSKGKSVSSELDQFNDLGLFQTNTNVNNEVVAFQSPAVMAEVVKRLSLDMNYYSPGRFHREVAYGSKLPVKVSLPDMAENESASFTLDLDPSGDYSLRDIVRGKERYDEIVKGSLRDTVPTPLGAVVVSPTAVYEPGTERRLYVSKSGMYSAVNGYCARLTVALNSKETSVINLTCSDNSIQRAEDVLNTLISVYNENWVRDKNQIAISTSRFINERLGVIEQELGSVDSDISSYKSEHLLPDVQAASQMYMQQSTSNNAQIMALNNQLYMARYIRDHLSNDANRLQLIPANSGIESIKIESQIAEYNNQLLERNSLLANTSQKNPLVVQMEEQLSNLRSAIILSVDNQMAALNAQIKSLQASEAQTTARIASNPTQAKYLLSVERQQKVKESLYLFLLQKREENELSQAFTAYNTRIITPPNGSLSPTAPVRNKILLCGLVMGLLIPVVVIYLRESMNTKIRGRKDLEALSVPFVGEIPQFETQKTGLLQRKAPQRKAVVVKEGSRDIINEAFRVLRTNLEFMTESADHSNVICVTSFNPGSGKSFLSVNIAVSLAIKGKRVLVIDGDLRHGSASQYVGSPKVGLSDFLGCRTDSLNDIIIQSDKHENFSMIPIGTMPPNPTELLFNPRLKQVIDNVRELFDYVLIDCPPVEMVADTQIIEKLADRTVFVVRAGLLERSMLPELDALYAQKKYKNMALILNGTVGATSRYSYKYGYRYGYHYGYGTSYHYGSTAKDGGKSPKKEKAVSGLD